MGPDSSDIRRREIGKSTAKPATPTTGTTVCSGDADDEGKKRH